MKKDSKDKPKGMTYGVLGIIFAIISLFFFPIIFGPLAIVFGIIAINKGDKKLGIIAIILGIVLAIIGAFLGVYSYDANYNLTNKFDQDKWVKESLEEDGYEVLFVHYSNYSEEAGGGSYINMKSLGNLNNQVNDALITLGVAYPNATAYYITLLTPTNECYYAIEGDLYRTYTKSYEEKVYWKNGTEIDSLTLYSLIHNPIELETKECTS